MSESREHIGPDEALEALEERPEDPRLLFRAGVALLRAHQQQRGLGLIRSALGRVTKTGSMGSSNWVGRQLVAEGVRQSESFWSDLHPQLLQAGWTGPAEPVESLTSWGDDDWHEETLPGDQGLAEEVPVVVEHHGGPRAKMWNIATVGDVDANGMRDVASNHTAGEGRGRVSELQTKLEVLRGAGRRQPSRFEMTELEPVKDLPEGHVTLPHGVLLAGAERVYGENSAITREGDEGTNLFYVTSGQVALSRLIRGVEVEVYRIERKGFFGELGLLGDGVRHYTARALRDTRTVTLSKRVVREVMRNDATIDRVLRDTYRRRLLELTLRTSPLLHVVDEEQARRFLAGGRPIMEPAHRRVVVEGEIIESVYMVLLGRLTARSVGRGSQQRHLQLGDCFGHEYGVTQGKSAFSVETDSFSQLLEIKRQRFEELVREPSVERILEALARNYCGMSA